MEQLNQVILDKEENIERLNKELLVQKDIIVEEKSVIEDQKKHIGILK